MVSRRRENASQDLSGGRNHPKSFLSYPFCKDVRALKPEDAIEKIYMDLGSQHRVKRIHMKVNSIQEISVDETEDPVIKALNEW